MIGTLLIAIPGYGMALLSLVATCVTIVRIAQHPTGRDCGGLVAALFGCAIATIAFAAVTRWLLGGAL